MLVTAIKYNAEKPKTCFVTPLSDYDVSVALMDLGLNESVNQAYFIIHSISQTHDITYHGITCQT